MQFPSAPEFAQRLLEASHLGHSQLAELRAATECSLELHQQLASQAQALCESADRGDAPGDSTDATREQELEELRSELEWTRSQLMEARERLESAPASGPTEAELLAELEQAQRELSALQERSAASCDASLDDHEHREQVEQYAAELAQRDEQIAVMEAQRKQLQESLEAREADREQPFDPAEITDEIVLRERETLRMLQQEWHQKLRSAELEISVERARIAREKAQMEERIQVMESEIERLQEVNGGAGKKEPSGGRWFARLGLNRED